MKCKKLGFLNLICGKQGRNGKRKLSVEISMENNTEHFLIGFSVWMIFFFAGFVIEIEKKQKGNGNDGNVSQETTDNDSV